MAGRIRDEDVRAVRDASQIAEVVGDYLQLRSAGGGNLKGLCPFHDEKSPSFNVTPSRGMYYCFGCGEGGDVITFVTKIEGLNFNEAVERLAKRAKIELRYAEGGYTKRSVSSERARLLEANQAAAQYYREQLNAPGARLGRELLAGRGFDQGAAERFRLGYAPDGWDHLVRHLMARGFTERELLTSGLASEGQRGLIDKFRHRLMWPIVEQGGEIIGFGGRRLNDADTRSPKYLNTPETPLYKKSSVLYGLDLARREIVNQRRAVVVEGYTDVMACHLAGEGTAIATCGTAFGEEHIKILRRLTGDRNEYLGIKIVFAFDGDAAGRKAALRVFEDNDRFVGQTYVAVQPDGLDPCDLRMARGDAAVRDLLASEVSLAEFVIRTKIGEHDVDSSEGRVRALREAARIVAGVPDSTQRDQYTRDLAKWLGMELDVVQPEIRRARPAQTRSARGSVQVQPPAQQQTDRRRAAPAAVSGPAAPAVPPRDRLRQREALQVALQYPKSAGTIFDDLEPSEFTVPEFAIVRLAIAAAGGCAATASPEVFREQVMAAAPDDRIRGLINQLLVEPLQMRRTTKSQDKIEQTYVETKMSAVRLSAVERAISLLRAEMLRAGASGGEQAQVPLLQRLQEYQQYAAQLKARYSL
jgi:DNA primase